MLQKIVPILVCTVLMLLATFSTLHSAEINLPRSGQTSSYASGDDGAVQAGLPWPAQRFTAANGAVTDNLTGLVWLQNANCYGSQAWVNALASANSLASGACGLSDSSAAGQWRLPTRLELESLVDASKSNPALPTGHPFSAVQADSYWSSTTYAGDTAKALYISMNSGVVDANFKTNSGVYVWPVRGGQ